MMSVDQPLSPATSGPPGFVGGAPMDDVLFSPKSTDRISTENINEALYLFVMASVGLFFNIVVIVCILTTRTLRKMTSSFILHGCALDAVKCLYCVPFATSLLRDVAPGFCAVLGGSYVVIVTASGFNIVAMICCEAYAFSEHNVGAEGRGSLCCAVFGILMVYVGSIIIHLGPTIIGGDFNYNDLIGNCIFVYGTVKSYVVHTMWIAIMTMAMVGAVYYLVYFYRHIKANTTHRLASLVRASIAISRGNVAADTQNSIRTVIRQTLSRSRVLILITALFMLCWYPLYLLTLVDPKFQQPTKIYKLLTFIAWSNGAVNPIVLILFDQNIDVFHRLCSHLLPPCVKRVRRRGGLPWPAGGGSGSSRHDQGQQQQVPQSGTSTPGGGSRANTLSRSHASDVMSFPDSVYQRVGCRLCTEGQAQSDRMMSQCNGRMGDRNLTRDLSICELHTLAV